MRSPTDRSYRRRADGAIDSVQRMTAPHPLVEPTGDGAHALGRAYWLAVRSAGHGLVRCRESERGLELRLLGLRPSLLAFGPARVTTGPERVSCTYRITGGLLARRATGTLDLTQAGCASPELEVAVQGFVPRFAGLHEPLQRRIHIAVSRRYFRRLLAAGRR